MIIQTIDINTKKKDLVARSLSPSIVLNIFILIFVIGCVFKKIKIEFTHRNKGIVKKKNNFLYIILLNIRFTQKLQLSLRAGKLFGLQAIINTMRNGRTKVNKYNLLETIDKPIITGSKK